MTRSQLFSHFRWIVLIAALMLSSGQAFAVDEGSSANLVMRGCHSLIEDGSDPDFESGICLGVIWGVADLGQVGKFICSPDGVTRNQMAGVVVQYIDARPARM